MLPAVGFSATLTTWPPLFGITIFLVELIKIMTREVVRETERRAGTKNVEKDGSTMPSADEKCDNHVVPLRRVRQFNCFAARDVAELNFTHQARSSLDASRASATDDRHPFVSAGL